MGAIGLIFMIISVCVEIVKLIIALRKSNPALAKECQVAMQEARKAGDMTRLQALLERLKKENKC